MKFWFSKAATKTEDEIQHDKTCFSDAPPVAVYPKNGLTYVLWSCEFCPGFWIEQLDGEWTHEQIQEAAKTGRAMRPVSEAKA